MKLLDNKYINEISKSTVFSMCDYERPDRKFMFKDLIFHHIFEFYGEGRP